MWSFFIGTALNFVAAKQPTITHQARIDTISHSSTTSSVTNATIKGSQHYHLTQPNQPLNNQQKSA